MNHINVLTKDIEIKDVGIIKSDEIEEFMDNQMSDRFPISNGTNIIAEDGESYANYYKRNDTFSKSSGSAHIASNRELFPAIRFNPCGLGLGSILKVRNIPFVVVKDGVAICSDAISNKMETVASAERFVSQDIKAIKQHVKDYLESLDIKIGDTVTARLNRPFAENKSLAFNVAESEIEINKIDVVTFGEWEGHIYKTSEQPMFENMLLRCTPDENGNQRYTASLDDGQIKYCYIYNNYAAVDIDASADDFAARSKRALYPACHFTPCGLDFGDTFELNETDFIVQKDGYAIATKPIATCTSSDISEELMKWSAKSKEPIVETGLKEITISNRYNVAYAAMAQGHDEVETIRIAKGIDAPRGNAKLKAFNVKTVILPDEVSSTCDLSQSFPNADFIYRNREISNFLNIDGDGVQAFDAIKSLIESNIPLSRKTVGIAIECIHERKDIKTALCDYKIYGTIRNAFPRDFKDSTLMQLKEAFKESEKFHGNIPKIVKDLAIMQDATRISSQDVIDNFNVNFVKRLMKQEYPVIPSLIAKSVAGDKINAIISNDITEDVASLVIDYSQTEKKCYKNAYEWIINHKDTNPETISDVREYANKLTFTDEDGKDLSVKNINKQITAIENLDEVEKINNEYNDALDDCTMNCIPVMQTNYGDNISRILDLSDEQDVALAANLGYLTNCCQHLGGAGETAMMHGFLYPDAGFFVIEGKDGDVKAQAEIWLHDKNTLVFDNIEFANTDDIHYEQRVKELSPDLAYFCENSPYKNIIMGTGFNDMDVSDFEEVEYDVVPKTTFEERVIFERSEAEGYYEDYDEYSNDYYEEHNRDPYELYNNMYPHEIIQTIIYNGTQDAEFIYTDAEESVYLKHDGYVAHALYENYDKEKAGEISGNTEDTYDYSMIESYIERKAKSFDGSMIEPKMLGFELSSDVCYYWNNTVGYNKVISDFDKGEGKLQEVCGEHICIPKEIAHFANFIAESKQEISKVKDIPESDKKFCDKVDEILDEIHGIFEKSSNNQNQDEEYDESIEPEYEIEFDAASEGIDSF